MTRAFRHTGVLMMLAVVALGLVGAAYALWYEDLQLTANVSTAKLDADVSFHPWTSAGGFSSTSGNGNGHPVVAQVGAIAPTVATLLGSNYAAFGDFPSGKPTTTCAGAIGTYGTNGTNANDTVDNNQLSLTLGGLYPYAGCEFEIDLHNDGGIPFHIALTSVSLQSCTDNTYTSCTNVPAAPWSIGLAPGSNAACTAFLGAIATAAVNTQINSAPNTPVQIHDGQDLVCRFKLILDQANVENSFFKFSAVYRAYQWNEAPYGP